MAVYRALHSGGSGAARRHTLDSFRSEGLNCIYVSACQIAHRTFTVGCRVLLSLTEYVNQ